MQKTIIINVSDVDYLLAHLSAEQANNALRQLRDKECFSYVNRGAAWYTRLSEEQREELDAWYQAWLEVTNTHIVPTRPKWLN